MLLPVIAPVVRVIIENIVNMYDNIEPDAKLCCISGFLFGITIIGIPIGASAATLYPFMIQLLTYFGFAGAAIGVAVDLPSPNACLFK